MVIFTCLAFVELIIKLKKTSVEGSSALLRCWSPFHPPHTHSIHLQSWVSGSLNMVCINKFFLDRGSTDAKMIVVCRKLKLTDEYLFDFEMREVITTFDSFVRQDFLVQPHLF
jgi:hypothetical protein